MLKTLVIALIFAVSSLAYAGNQQQQAMMRNAAAAAQMTGITPQVLRAIALASNCRDSRWEVISHGFLNRRCGKKQDNHIQVSWDGKIEEYDGSSATFLMYIEDFHMK